MEPVSVEQRAVKEWSPAARPEPVSLRGSVLVLMQFDVCEEIRLEELRGALQTSQRPSGRTPAPGQVRYQRPPVVERTGPLVLPSGEVLEGEIKFYDYGVLSFIFQLPFAGEWEDLTRLASHWVWDVDFAGAVRQIAEAKLARIAGTLVKPYKEWISEDYFIFHAREVAGSPSGEELIAQHGGRIAQVVRGETARLAESECNEVLQSRISYYPNDLAVIGWNAAFLYDSAAGADTAVQLLEYANSQLLEFRHYDQLLTDELDGVYTSLDEGFGLLARWRLARSATKLRTVLLEVDELTEHADNAIKFLSDMFAARLYRLAASKVGVPDYKNLVTQKSRTAEELYRFMVDQFNQSRTFLLETTVVIILVVELIFLFRGGKGF